MTLVDYTSIKIKENNDPMVDLESSELAIEPKYFKQGLSTDPKLYLREETVTKLLRVQRSLGKLELKIWDAFRSRDVQNSIYQKYWNDKHRSYPQWDKEKLRLEVGKFVSPPYEKDQVPPHSTGGAVDITLLDENKKELDMGTEFDSFGPEANPFFFAIYKNKPNITKNRRILREAMEAEGFTIDESEWWHFDYGNQMWALKSGKPFAIYGETCVG